MADDRSKFPVSPFRPKPEQTVDIEEVIALRAIVMKLVANAANESEMAGGPPSQVWVNEFAESCANAISKMESPTAKKEKHDDLRPRVLKWLNIILGGIVFPKVKGGN
jgi:hypothetical protein